MKSIHTIRSSYLLNPTARFLSRTLLFFLLLADSAPAPAQELSLGCVSAAPGERVEIPIDFIARENPVVALQWDVGFDPAMLDLEESRLEPIASDHIVANHLLRTVVYSASNAELDTDESGQRLLTLVMRVSEDASDGPIFLSIDNLVLSDASARNVAASSRGQGVVQVTTGIFADSFECGDASRWSETVP